MPPRYAYWTIIIDNAPTAFRAREREELLPTFRQLKSRNPNATIKWFSRGRLWESPEEARTAAAPPREARSKDWRPGGRHEDPRARFKKAGRGEFKKSRRPEAPASGSRAVSGPEPPPRENRPERRRFDNRPAGPSRRPSHEREARAEARPQGRPDRTRTDRRGPGAKPWGPPREQGQQGGARKGDSRPADRPRDGGPHPRDSGRPEFRGEKKDSRGRKPWTPKGPAEHRGRHVGGKPGSRRPGGGRPWERGNKPGSGVPTESEPPVPPPPEPPGPDRPPRPGEEPRPETPGGETIRILPEPPERARK